MKPLFDRYYLAPSKFYIKESDIELYQNLGYSVYREDGIVGDILRWVKG